MDKSDHLSGEEDAPTVSSPVFVAGSSSRRKNALPQKQFVDDEDSSTKTSALATSIKLLYDIRIITSKLLDAQDPECNNCTNDDVEVKQQQQQQQQLKESESNNLTTTLSAVNSTSQVC